jgi:hypothetical protein
MRRHITNSAKKKLGHYQLKKRKQWFDEGCSELLDQRKKSQIAVVTGPKRNGDNLNNERYEASRYFKKNKRGYLKDKIIGLPMKSKNMNIGDLCRGKNEFKRGYQPRSNLVTNENADLLSDSHNILNRWKNTSLSY